MKSSRSAFFCLALTAATFVSAHNARVARACSATTPMSFYGGYVDAYDQPGNIYYVFWGYGTYGDPQSFQPAANAIFNNVAPLESLGIGATRFNRVTSQYAGYDWNTGSYTQIAPTPDAYFLWDEGGLPAPDPVTGQITLTDADVSAEADFMASYYSVSYDDIFVIFTPSNAPPPISVFCGQHFVTSNDRITAWVAYPQGGCSFSNQQAAVMHEITEATANPAYNDGTSYEGWDQGTGATCEIGDLCNGIQYKVQTQPASNTPSQITTQQEFSNEAVAAGKSGCIYGRSTKAYVVGLFTKTSTSLVSTTVSANTSISFPNSPGWGAPTGVTLTGSPAAASWGEGHIDAFVRGTDGKMYHATTDDEGTTVTWEQLNSSASFTQSPDAVSWGGGNVQVFGVQGTNIVKNTKDYGSSWSGWTTVNKPAGINPSSKVTVASWGATNTSGGFPSNVRTVLAAFRGSDGKVWVGNSVSGGSFTWSSFTRPATLTGDPDISAWAPPRFDLFVLDTSGNFWDMYSTNGTTVAGSVNFGHPSAGGFQVGAGAAGMGDGRLLVGGRVGTNSAYLQLWNWATGSWVSTIAPYISGIDITSP